MQISDLNPLNWHARRALQRAVNLLQRAVTPRVATDAERVRGAAEVKAAAWQAAQPQTGTPRPPGPREINRRSAGNPPPSIDGAGYNHLAWSFLDPDPVQQRLWASEEAKYGRVTTAYGPTPQAYSSQASVGLTIERLAIINQEASRDGYLTHKADLDFEIAQKWGHQKTAHRQRVAAVFRSPLQLRPRNKTNLGRFVCAFVRGVLDDIPGFIKAEEDLLGAGRSGYSGQEVVWKTPRTRRVTVGRKTYTIQEAKGVESLEWVHTRDFRWDPIKRRMLLDAGGARYINPFSNPDGSPTRKLILHGGDGEGDPHQRGYAYATDLLYMLSFQSLSRWAVALEFFGVATPYMQYEGDGHVDDNDVADAITFLTALGRGQPAVLHKKFGKVDITPTPTGIDARGQHAAILGYLNSECSKCVAGQTLTMEIGGSGSYAAANVQGDSKEEVQVIDARLEADTQTHQTVRFIVEENAVQLARAYGCTPAAVLAEIPVAYRVVDRRMDPKDRLAVFIGSSTPRDKGGLGLEIEPDQIAEELNLRLVDAEPEDEIAGSPSKEDQHILAMPNGTDLPDLELTATDLATIVTVNEARKAKGLAPLEEDGDLTIAEFKAKHSTVVADAAAAEQGKDSRDEGSPVKRSLLDEDPHVMVALYPPIELARELALPGGEDPEELHVTLAYLGRRASVGDLELLRRALAVVARQPVLAGRVGGIGIFPPSESSKGRAVAWVPVDVPGLVELRQEVIRALGSAGEEPASSHGYTPHITLEYLAPGALPPRPLDAHPVEFSEIWLVCGEERYSIRLGGDS